MIPLPPGFVLDDTPSQAPTGLPEGFVLDSFDARFGTGPMASGATTRTAPLDQALEAKAATMRPSKTKSAVLGAGQGVLSNFADEAASGVNAAIDVVAGQPGGFGAAYDRRLAEARAQMAEAEAVNPKSFLSGQVGGGIALAAAAPALGAGIRGSAATGAAYGALSGAGVGESPEGRLGGAAIGGAAGGAIGAAAPYVVSGVAATGRAIGNAVTNAATPIRGFVNPEAEAARRVASAFQRDVGAALPETLAAGQAAQEAGAPLILADLGGETVRGTLRSAANTSTEARNAIEGAVRPRFETQGPRAVDLVKRITGGVDSLDTQDALQAAARKANRPAYAKAYAQGSGGVWDDELAQLASAPAVQAAIKDATRTGANRAAADGFRPVKNPFTTDAEGRVVLSTREDGSVATPSLQFWDHVKRNLDDAFTKAQRAGANSEAADIAELRSQIVGKLDTMVPSFGEARAGAARFFGAQDALEAGGKFVTAKVSNGEAARALAKMSEPEKKLFASGFGDTLIKRINETADRRSILNSVFVNSPAARQRIQMALGKDNAAALEAHLRVEQMMDVTRNALGNSTTTRQLVEMGLAGGVGGVLGASTGEGGVQNFSFGAVLGGLARAGKIKIDQNVARKVGEMLASSDIAAAEKAMKMVARQPKLMQAIRDADEYLAKFAAPYAERAGQAANTNLLSGPVRGAASNGQPEQEK